VLVDSGNVQMTTPPGEDSDVDEPSDAEDGAGQINFIRLKEILDNNRYFFRDMADGDFVSCGTGCRKYIVATLTIPALTALRVALAYQSCTQGATPQLNNDFDLALNCGNPLQACGGTSLSNTMTSELEMLERPGCSYSRSCSIEIRIKGGAAVAACGSTTTERVGVAWSLR